MDVKLIMEINHPNLNPNWGLLKPLDKRIIQYIWNEPENKDDFQLAESLKIPLDRIRKSLSTLANLRFLNERNVLDNRVSQ